MISKLISTEIRRRLGIRSSTIKGTTLVSYVEFCRKKFLLEKVFQERKLITCCSFPHLQCWPKPPLNLQHKPVEKMMQSFRFLSKLACLYFFVSSLTVENFWLFCNVFFFLFLLQRN